MNMIDVVIDNRRVQLDQVPNHCPLCNRKIDPIDRKTYNWLGNIHQSRKFEIVMQCPSNQCMHLFICRYEQLSEKKGYINGYFSLTASLPYEHKANNFDDKILELSPLFCEIYRQASHAEKLRLDQISGIGYRKALEFLIKDFCISENLDKEEQIKKSLLGKCITDYISDERIKECARRATWIGNDETHYVRKWQDKDIRDLKILIQLSSHWITSHLLTNQYLAEMN